MRGFTVLLLLLFISGNSYAETAPLKIGFVYIGPVGDHGWNYQHDQARLALEKEFGDRIKTTYVENVPESADAQRVFTQLAKTGHKLIFATSFGYMNPVAKTAKRFPQVIFEQVNGYKQSRNMTIYQAKTYEALFVSGYLAASMSKTGKVGYLGTFPIATVIRDINATKLGMSLANPKAELKVVWLSTWYDPVKETDATNLLIDQGVDVVLQQTDSTAPTQVAQRRGAYAIGLSSDMAEYGPDAHLFTVMTDWTSYYTQQTREVLAGKWKPVPYWGGFKENTVFLSPFNKVIPQALQTKAKKLIADISAGRLHPFQGPIWDNKGVLRIPQGQQASIDDIATMNWLVKGVK